MSKEIDDCICGHPFAFDRMQRGTHHLKDCPKYTMTASEKDSVLTKGVGVKKGVNSPTSKRGNSQDTRLPSEKAGREIDSPCICGHRLDCHEHTIVRETPTKCMMCRCGKFVWAEEKKIVKEKPTCKNCFHLIEACPLNKEQLGYCTQEGTTIMKKDYEQFCEKFRDKWG